MVNLSEQSKETTGSLLSMLNNRTIDSDVGPNSSTYDLLVAIFNIMVDKEHFKVLQDELDDDKNDQRHLKREQRHNELLQALGVTPGVHIPKKEKKEIDFKKLNLTKYFKKHKVKEPEIPQKIEKKAVVVDKGFSLGSIAKVGVAAAAVGIIGAGLFSGGKSALAKVIGQGESFGGNPTAYNVKKGTTYEGHLGKTDEGIPITEMSVGKIRELQTKGKMFAVGKWQMTPSTLAAAIKAGYVKENDVFNEATQNKLLDFLIDKAGGKGLVRKYINGDPTVSRDDAIAALAMEWAALGVPYDMQGAKHRVKKGESYYSGIAGNKASISPELVGQALDKDRDNIMAEKMERLKNTIGLSMNEISKDNQNITNEIDTTPLQSNITNNFNANVSERSQIQNLPKEDDRSVYEKRGLVQ